MNQWLPDPWSAVYGPASFLQGYIFWQNAFLFSIDLIVIGLFASYIANKIKLGFWRSPSTDAAIAFLIYFLGMAAVRGALLMMRADLVESKGWLVSLMIAGTILSVVGATYMLRLFAEYTWRSWFVPWVISVIVASVAALLFTLFG